MDNDVVIKVENVSKKYCKSLKRSMFYGISDIGRNLVGMGSHSERLRESEFWAVDDVSFELRKGEALGLIGPNGSGKSTLLKMLNGIFWPDKGKITVKGRVGALIEVGAGFHPLLTGRENVYINAAILGMTKKEVDKKFDDIIEFAGIGDFIDAPVRSYSSGMYVRLGFAIAVHSDPDILLVDEVLAVGDVNFQNKCYRQITKMIDHCALILVSHNPHHIRFLCNKVLFLNGGKKQFLGSSPEGVDNYLTYMMRQTPSPDTAAIRESKYGSKAELESIRILDNCYNEIGEVFASEDVIIECFFKINEPIHHAIVGVGLRFDGIEQSFSAFSSQVNGSQYYDLTEGEYKCRILIPKISLRAGMYNVGVVVSENHVLAQHVINTKKYLVVKNPRPEFGLYNMNVQFEMHKEQPSPGA